MDEKEYNEAFKRAKELHEAGNALTKQQMEIVFPQLAESGSENLKNLSGYYKAGKFWKASTLWEATKDKIPQRVPNRYILQKCTWNIGTLQEFADEIKNIQEVSLDYPIILDMNGNILDGAHRVVKAYLEGKDIDIVYLGDDEWPEPDYDEEKAVKESEDERIRKEIIEFIYSKLDSGEMTHYHRNRVKSWISYLEKQKEPIPIPDKFSGLKSLMLQYLQSAANREDDTEIESDTDLWGRKILDYVWKYDEKQKEQQPAEWSEEDERNLSTIVGLINVHYHDYEIVRDEYPINAHNLIDWLNSLPERFSLRPKQEWSEEDRMETINVFRPLAGTSIESATKQAVNKFTNSGEKFLLAFNGVFILIDNTKSVQDIVSEYNRSLGGKKKEQGQSEEEPNDFEITLNDCMLAAQQYPPGKIGLDDVKMWAEELSNYCPKPNQKWSEFDWHCLERAIWYVENPAPTVVKDTNLVLWLKSLRPSWKPSEEQMTRLSECVIEARERHRASTSGYERYRILNSLYIDLRKLM